MVENEIVIFRKWCDNGTIIALFPEIVGDAFSYIINCSSKTF